MGIHCGSDMSGAGGEGSNEVLGVLKEINESVKQIAANMGSKSASEITGSKSFGKQEAQQVFSGSGGESSTSYIRKKTQNASKELDKFSSEFVNQVTKTYQEITGKTNQQIQDSLKKGGGLNKIINNLSNKGLTSSDINLWSQAAKSSGKPEEAAITAGSAKDLKNLVGNAPDINKQIELLSEKGAKGAANYTSRISSLERADLVEKQIRDNDLVSTTQRKMTLMEGLASTHNRTFQNAFAKGEMNEWIQAINDNSKTEEEFTEAIKERMQLKEKNNEAMGMGMTAVSELAMLSSSLLSSYGNMMKSFALSPAETQAAKKERATETYSNMLGMSAAVGGGLAGLSVGGPVGLLLGAALGGAGQGLGSWLGAEMSVSLNNKKTINDVFGKDLTKEFSGLVGEIGNELSKTLPQAFSASMRAAHGKKLAASNLTTGRALSSYNAFNMAASADEERQEFWLRLGELSRTDRLGGTKKQNWGGVSNAVPNKLGRNIEIEERTKAINQFMKNKGISPSQFNKLDEMARMMPEVVGAQQKNAYMKNIKDLLHYGQTSPELQQSMATIKNMGYSQRLKTEALSQAFLGMGTEEAADADKKVLRGNLKKNRMPVSMLKGRFPELYKLFAGVGRHGDEGEGKSDLETIISILRDMKEDLSQEYWERKADEFKKIISRMGYQVKYPIPRAGER